MVQLIYSDEWVNIVALEIVLKGDENMFRVLFELIRIIAIILIFGSIMGAIVKLIYSSFGINVENTSGGWVVGFSILILIFVLYRNRLQFSGFYQGNGKVKLPKKVSIFLISCSVLMLLLAPIFS